MKKVFFIFLFVAACIVTTYAQKSVTMRVTNNDDLNNLLTDSRFLFPEFQDARVYTKESIAELKVNYNLLSDEMLFINSKGDTLAIKDANSVLAVIVGERKFKYSPKGFVEELAVSLSDDTELLLRHAIRQGDRRKYGAYGTTSSVSSITNVTSANHGQYKLTTAEEISFSWDNQCYLNTLGKYRIANKSSFLKVFPKKKSAIEDYLKQNPVDFDKEEDVLRLFNFCTGSK